MNLDSIIAGGWRMSGVVSPLGVGHINDTYLVVAGGGRWVLQRINRAVFADPAALMANMERVVRHLTMRAPGFVPALVATTAGGWFHVDDKGDYWRMSQFVAGTRTLQRLENAAQALAAGGAFARYQNLLADLSGPPLIDPIPEFLRLKRYLAQFDTVVERRSRDPAIGRWQSFVDQRRWLAREIQQVEEYIHGDCKVNNLLFRGGSNQVCAVVDLDTTMHGHWAWDFGDLVRSGAVAGAGFSIELFAALADGFVGTKKRAVAVDDLVIAPRYVCLMLGVRFLTDHLEGDRYFKVSARGDNLRRADQQFRLLQDMEAAEKDMARIVRRYG